MAAFSVLAPAPSQAKKGVSQMTASNGGASPVTLEVVLRYNQGTGEFSLAKPEGSDLVVMGMLAMAGHAIMGRKEVSPESGRVLHGPRLA
jgi:hypothetical protein